MSRASVAIETLRKRNPLAVRLAEAVSFAVVIDRALLRAARIDLVPQADAGTEADLWFSSMVQSRTADGIVLDREVAEEVRRNMTPAQVEAAWRVISREHAWLSPSLKLEEEIAYLSVSSEPGAHELMVERIQSVIRAMLGGNRPGLAQWAARALAMFPSAVRDLPETRMLDAGTRIRLGQGIQTAADEPLPSWMSLLAPSSMARAELQVELRERELVLGGASGTPIHVPDTNPRVLEVAWEEAGRARAKQVTLRRGETTRVPVGDDVVRLRTITGEQYDVREVAELSTFESLLAETIDFSEEIARHARVVGREEALEYLLQIKGRIVITGKAGVGRTALLCELIRRLAPAPVFVHFFRTGDPRLESLEAAHRSLAAQIAIRYRLDEAVIDVPLQHVLERLALSPRRPERLYIVIDDMQDARVEGYDNPHGPPLTLFLPSVPDFVTVYSTGRLIEEEESVVHFELLPADETVLTEFTGEPRLAALSEGNFGKAEVLVALAKAGIEVETFSDVQQTLASPEADLLAIARRPLPFELEDPQPPAAVLRVDERGVALMNRTLRRALGSGTAAPHLVIVWRLEKVLDDDRATDYYTLYAVDHLLAAEEQERAQQLVGNVTFMREVVRRHGAALMRDQLRRVAEAAAPRESGLEGVSSTDLVWFWRALAAFEANFDALTAAPEDLDAVLAAYFRREQQHLPPGFLVAESAERDRHRLPPRRHEQPITGCARIDENHVATWSSDGTVMIWPREERSLAPLVVHYPAAITAFAQVGTFAVIGDALGFLHVVRTESGELASKITAHDGAVAGVVAAEETPLIATWSDNAVIRLWLVTSPDGIIEETGELVGHEEEVTGCSFADDGRLLVSSSRDSTIRVWNVEARRAVRVIRNGSPVIGLSVSFDGSWLAAVDEARRLRIEGVETEAAPDLDATMIQTDQGPITGITRSRYDRYCATWSEDGLVVIWRIPFRYQRTVGPDRLKEFASKPESRVVTCAFVGHQPRLFVSWSDGTAVLVDPEGAKTAIDSGGTVLRVVADFDEYFYTGDDRGTLAEWDVQSGRMLRDYSKAPGRIDAVAAGAGDVLVSDGGEVWIERSSWRIAFRDAGIAVRKDRVALWEQSSGTVYNADLRTGRVHNVTPGTEGRITVCAAGASSDATAVGHDNGPVLLFDSSIEVEVPSARPSVTALAFIEEDNGLVSSYANGELRLSRSGRSLSFNMPIDEVVAIEVDDMQKRLAVTSADDTIRVLSFASDLQLVSTLQGKVDPAVRCRFSLDGASLIATDRDHVIHIWNPETAEERAACRGHRARITGIAVGEGVIFSSSEDRTVRMWDLDTGEQLAVVYGYNAFRCLDAGAHAIVAGDDAGQLWRFTRAAPALGAVQVFISNALEDRELAEKLNADLRRWGVRTWSAMSSLAPGEQWVEAIDQALRRSAALVVISSEAANRSESIRREVQTFQMRKDPFTFAVAVDDAQLFPDIEPLDMRRWRDPFAYERQFAELMARLRSRLGGEEAAT